MKREKGETRLDLCPNCGSAVLKTWRELSDDERFIAIRRGLVPDSEPRPGEKFCARCLTQVGQKESREA